MMLIKTGMHALYSLSRCLNASFAQRNTLPLKRQLEFRNVATQEDAIFEQIIETFVQYLPSVRLVTSQYWF